jgi:hypothetical protein
MQTDSLPTAETKQPKRRWYQYSLRSLFLLTLLVALGMSWLTVTMRSQRQQKAAAEAIEKAGGTVNYETTWLGKLLRDDSLVKVTAVGLPRGSATDPALVHLQGLSQLQLLELTGTQVTDAGLMHLQGLSQLQRLFLDNTQVTDAGLVHLQGLSQLQTLWLGSTKVTDAGLPHLQGLSRLQALQLRDTKVTDQGVKKLQKALSNCHIYH